MTTKTEREVLELREALRKSEEARHEAQRNWDIINQERQHWSEATDKLRENLNNQIEGLKTALREALEECEGGKFDSMVRMCIAESIREVLNLHKE